MEIKRVGVVGCGLMGRGIVEVSIKAGYDVIVSEISQELLDKGLKAITAPLVRAVHIGKSTEEEKNILLNRITGTTKVEDFKECDLVIEAAPESLDLKKNIFHKLDEICQQHTVLATNTSVLSVTDIAAATGRQDKVLGMHFFNPVPMMKLIELVRTIMTSDETVQVARAYGESMDKKVVVAKDTPGFIVNRLSMPLLLEAIRMLESGVATREDIDRAVKWGMNHPMGPLSLADFVGLDSIYFICNAMYDDLKDPSFAPPILLKKMVAAGHLGRKSGRGFYQYQQP